MSKLSTKREKKNERLDDSRTSKVPASKNSPIQTYRSRHSIGRRLATERVGSYHESEVAITLQGGYWPGAKISGARRKSDTATDVQRRPVAVTLNLTSDAGLQAHSKQKVKRKADVQQWSKMVNLTTEPSSLKRRGSGIETSCSKEKYVVSRESVKRKIFPAENQPVVSQRSPEIKIRGKNVDFIQRSAISNKFVAAGENKRRVSSPIRNANAASFSLTRTTKNDIIKDKKHQSSKRKSESSANRTIDLTDDTVSPNPSERKSFVSTPQKASLKGAGGSKIIDLTEGPESPIFSMLTGGKPNISASGKKSSLSTEKRLATTSRVNKRAEELQVSGRMLKSALAGTKRTATPIDSSKCSSQSVAKQRTKASRADGTPKCPPQARVKREACLNAGAFLRMMYQGDSPPNKKPRLQSDTPLSQTSIVVSGAQIAKKELTFHDKDQSTSKMQYEFVTPGVQLNTEVKRSRTNLLDKVSIRDKLGDCEIPSRELKSVASLEKKKIALKAQKQNCDTAGEIRSHKDVTKDILDTSSATAKTLTKEVVKRPKVLKKKVLAKTSDNKNVGKSENEMTLPKLNEGKSETLKKRKDATSSKKTEETRKKRGTLNKKDDRNQTTLKKKQRKSEQVVFAMLPKRMANLNAQAMLAASREKWESRPKARRSLDSLVSAPAATKDLSPKLEAPSATSCMNTTEPRLSRLNDEIISSTPKRASPKSPRLKSSSPKRSNVVIQNRETAVSSKSLSSRKRKPVDRSMLSSQLTAVNSFAEGGSINVTEGLSTATNQTSYQPETGSQLLSSSQPMGSGSQNQTGPAQQVGSLVMKESSTSLSAAGLRYSNAPSPAGVGFIEAPSPSIPLPESRVQFAGTCAQTTTPTPNKRLVDLTTVHKTKSTGLAPTRLYGDSKPAASTRLYAEIKPAEVKPPEAKPVASVRQYAEIKPAVSKPVGTPGYGESAPTWLGQGSGSLVSVVSPAFYPSQAGGEPGGFGRVAEQPQGGCLSAVVPIRFAAPFVQQNSLQMGFFAPMPAHYIAPQQQQVIIQQQQSQQQQPLMLQQQSLILQQQQQQQGYSNEYICSNVASPVGSYVQPTQSGFAAYKPATSYGSQFQQPYAAPMQIVFQPDLRPASAAGGGQCFPPTSHSFLLPQPAGQQLSQPVYPSYPNFARVLPMTSTEPSRHADAPATQEGGSSALGSRSDLTDVTYSASTRPNSKPSRSKDCGVQVQSRCVSGSGRVNDRPIQIRPAAEPANQALASEARRLESMSGQQGRVEATTGDGSGGTRLIFDNSGGNIEEVERGNGARAIRGIEVSVTLGVNAGSAMSMGGGETGVGNFGVGSGNAVGGKHTGQKASHSSRMDHMASGSVESVGPRQSAGKVMQTPVENRATGAADSTMTGPQGSPAGSQPGQGAPPLMPVFSGPHAMVQPLVIPRIIPQASASQPKSLTNPPKSSNFVAWAALPMAEFGVPVSSPGKKLHRKRAKPEKRTIELSGVQESSAMLMGSVPQSMMVSGPQFDRSAGQADQLNVERSGGQMVGQSVGHAFDQGVGRTAGHSKNQFGESSGQNVSRSVEVEHSIVQRGAEEGCQDKELDLSRKTGSSTDQIVTSSRGKAASILAGGESQVSSGLMDLTKKKQKKMKIQLPDVLMSTQGAVVISGARAQCPSVCQRPTAPSWSHAAAVVEVASGSSGQMVKGARARKRSDLAVIQPKLQSVAASGVNYPQSRSAARASQNGKSSIALDSIVARGGPWTHEMKIASIAAKTDSAILYTAASQSYAPMASVASVGATSCGVNRASLMLEHCFRPRSSSPDQSNQATLLNDPKGKFLGVAATATDVPFSIASLTRANPALANPSVVNPALANPCVVNPSCRTPAPGVSAVHVLPRMVTQKSGGVVRIPSEQAGRLPSMSRAFLSLGGSSTELDPHVGSQKDFDPLESPTKLLRRLPCVEKSFGAVVLAGRVCSMSSAESGGAQRSPSKHQAKKLASPGAIVKLPSPSVTEQGKLTSPNVAEQEKTSSSMTAGQENAPSASAAVQGRLPSVGVTNQEKLTFSDGLTSEGKLAVTGRQNPGNPKGLKRKREDTGGRDKVSKQVRVEADTSGEGRSGSDSKTKSEAKGDTGVAYNKSGKQHSTKESSSSAGGGRKSDTEEGGSKGKRRSTGGGEQRPKKVSPNRKKDAQGCKWTWQGDAETKLVINPGEGAPRVEMRAYPAVVHTDGSVVRVRDCVLVRSGMRKRDIPYVAKIYAFWEHESTGEMMMGVLWYYRLEHTETAHLPRYIASEVFASRHRDVVPVACIEDRCYVLTLNEFNRYKAAVKRQDVGVTCPPFILPADLESPLPRALPPLDIDQEGVLLCRHIYDVKLKRVLKNPQIHVNTSV